MTLEVGMKKFRERRLGFTLVELLIVMAIILLLTAILFPAVTGAKKSALIAKTQSDIKMLHSAINAFKNEYDRYPLHGTEHSARADIEYDNEKLMKTLLGNDENDNPRGFSFLNINEASMDEDGRFVDPWVPKGEDYGEPYEAMVDADYDGVLDVEIRTGDVNIDVVTNVAVAVWSLGDENDDQVGPFTSWGGEYVERDKK